MTEREELEAAARLALLFGVCRNDLHPEGHVWDENAGACRRCGARWPYTDGVREDK